MGGRLAGLMGSRLRSRTSTPPKAFVRLSLARHLPTGFQIMTRQSLTGRARARNPTALEAAIPRLRRGDSGALRSRAQPPKGGERSDHKHRDPKSAIPSSSRSLETQPSKAREAAWLAISELARALKKERFARFDGRLQFRGYAVRCRRSHKSGPQSSPLRLHCATSVLGEVPATRDWLSEDRDGRSSPPR